MMMFRTEGAAEMHYKQVRTLLTAALLLAKSLDTAPSD